ncbi:hypothetical protein E2C01_086009 [Portunus trituberculatus]|uniref:Uncharacterized protein n=1 Tax=Portunus trituberculatus TaxID=210409 RepID=A0A5B7IZM5_PORTR|nr:hypothetical protein [Portunus trituberculatus]
MCDSCVGYQCCASPAKINSHTFRSALLCLPSSPPPLRASQPRPAPPSPHTITARQTHQVSLASAMLLMISEGRDGSLQFAAISRTSHCSHQEYCNVLQKRFALSPRLFSKAPEMKSQVLKKVPLLIMYKSCYLAAKTLVNILKTHDRGNMVRNILNAVTGPHSVHGTVLRPML